MEPSESGSTKKVKFKESIVFSDESSWVWQLASEVLSNLGKAHVRIPSSTPITPNWRRFKEAPHLVIHWESTLRRGGALIEELRQLHPGLEILDRIYVLTESPTHEDVIYWGELGVYRVIRLRPRDKDLAQAARDLERHLTDETRMSDSEYAWRKLQDDVETMPKNPDPHRLQLARATFHALHPVGSVKTARSLDMEALLASRGGEDQVACELWTAALEKNPSYYVAYHHLIAHHRSCGRLEKAYALLSKVFYLNKSNIGRLIAMGEIQKDLADHEKAEAHFKAALALDEHCSRALNGLAEIRFEQGKLDESRDLLRRSQIAFSMAASLNRKGIELVRGAKYEEALRLYANAQYVLPIQDKGHLLFFNIGLCYSRWGKPDLAREFVQLALIKNPNYVKAQKLLQKLKDHFDKEAHLKTQEQRSQEEFPVNV